MRRRNVVLAAALVVGCRTPAPPESPLEEPATERSVARADELARESHPREARAIYEQVLRSHPDDTTAAHALYGLGRLEVAPGPQQDYRAARATFERLLAKYPDSQWAAEAAAWRTVLRNLEHSEAESASLRDELERMKELDMQQERHR